MGCKSKRLHTAVCAPPLPTPTTKDGIRGKCVEYCVEKEAVLSTEDIRRRTVPPGSCLGSPRLSATR